MKYKIKKRQQKFGLFCKIKINKNKYYEIKKNTYI